MTRRTFALILIASAALCGHARAALYAFSLEGEVTATLLPGVNIGDRVMIDYVADSVDLDPRPLFGKYWSSRLTLHLPGTSYSYAGESDEYLSIDIAASLHFVQYRDRVLHPEAVDPWTLSIAFAFPDNTLTDELPLVLPLPDAIVRRFAMIPIFNEVFRGNVTSYTSTQIPEPHYPCFLMALAFVWGRQQRTSPQRVRRLTRRTYESAHLRIVHGSRTAALCGKLGTALTFLDRFAPPC